jgi:transmembrane sensor
MSKTEPGELDRRVIVAYLLGEANEEERDLLERWRASDPANEAEFRRRQRVWELIGSAATEVEAPAGAPAASSHRTGRDTGQPPIPLVRPSAASRGGRVPAWIGVAAASLLIGFFAGQARSGSDRVDRFAVDELINRGDEVVTTMLSDGTVVRLAGSSRLRFSTGSGRDVELDGQAFFAVRPGQREPFRVQTSAGGVTVLGTRFDVVARGGRIDVVVVEGSVAIGEGNQRVTVGPSERGRASAGEPPVVEPIDDAFEATRWIGAFLAYESTPLAEVAAEISSRFDLEIDIGDSELAARTVTGRFIDQSPAEIVGNICIAVDARCTFSERLVRIESTDTPGARNEQ